MNDWCEYCKGNADDGCWEWCHWRTYRLTQRVYPVAGEMMAAISEGEPVVIRAPRVCLRKDCGGDDHEFKTWGGQIFRLHQHGGTA